MKRPPSRPQRWAEAVARAIAAKDELEAALSDLDEVRREYEDWRDNLPENLQGGNLADKLNTVADLDLDFSNFDFSVLDDAESADLPLGFGRD